MDNKAIETNIQQIKLLEAQKKDLEAMISKLKQDIQDEMDSRCVDNISTGLHNVFFTVYEKKTVDNNKLKADGLYDRYLKTSTVVQFKITDIK